MKFLRQLFFYYSFLYVLLVVVAGIVKHSSGQLINLVIITPILVYFLLFIIKNIINPFKGSFIHYYSILLTILATYSLFVSLFLLIGNLINFKYTPINQIMIPFLLPLPLFFSTVLLKKCFVKTNRIITIPDNQEGHIVNSGGENNNDIEEEPRRQFIKLIAGSGVGVLLVYLLNPTKAGAAFFGSIPGPGTIAIKDSAGTKIDPAIKSPTDSYGLANADETAYPHYFGFIHYNGTDWYILKETSDSIYTYASKLNNATLAYTDAWNTRATTTIFGAYSAAF